MQETTTIRASALDKRKTNKRINKLTAQGWRVVSTTQAGLGLMTITLVRDLPSSSLSPTPRPAVQRSGICLHRGEQLDVVQAKAATTCRECGEVTRSAVLALPSDVDDASLESLKAWVDQRPQGDALADYVRHAVRPLLPAD